MLGAFANNMCIFSLQDLGTHQTEQETAAQRPMVSVGSGPRMRLQVWEKRGRYGSKINYILGRPHSQRHCGEGLAGGHMKVNGSIIY